MKIKKNKFIFLLLFIINLVITIFATYILPEKYFLDVKTITLPEFNMKGFIGSYPFIQRFYELTLLKYLPLPIIGFIQFSTTSFLIYKIGIPNKFEILNLKNISIYVALTLSAIFLAVPSKEFVTFLMFSSIPFIYMSKREHKILISFILIFFFSIFRSYFMLIPVIAVGIYLVSFIKLKNKGLSTIAYGLLIVIFLSFSYGIVNGVFLSQTTREDYVSIYTKMYNVNSAIVSPIPQDTWYGEAFGIIYGFISVNFPIFEGIKHIFSPQILGFVIWQIIVFYILLKLFSKCINDRKQHYYELWTIIILFSYFMVQGVFEPDLGTSIRHKIGFLPLIYFAFYYDNIPRKNKSI